MLGGGCLRGIAKLACNDIDSHIAHRALLLRRIVDGNHLQGAAGFPGKTYPMDLTIETFAQRFGSESLYLRLAEVELCVIG